MNNRSWDMYRSDSQNEMRKESEQRQGVATP